MHISKADLKAIASRKVTKTEMAKRLGVSAAYLSRMTPKLPPGPIRAQRLAIHELAATRRAFRSKLAKEVLKGRRSLESAAKEAHCSIRTLYRYVCKLKK